MMLHVMQLIQIHKLPQLCDLWPEQNILGVMDDVLDGLIEACVTHSGGG